MKEERILNVLGEVDEKYIREADPEVKIKKMKLTWTKLAAMAACICLVIFGVFEFSGLFKESGGKNGLVVNKVKGTATADMDVKISIYNEISSEERNRVEKDFERVVGLSYNDFTAKIPDTFTINSFYSVDTPDSASEEEYTPHDYVFECTNEDGGEVKLAVSSLGANCRDCYLVTDNPVKSKINGTELVIYGWNGTYVAEFFHDGKYYDIETRNVTLDELEELLVSIME